MHENEIKEQIKEEYKNTYHNVIFTLVNRIDNMKDKIEKIKALVDKWSASYDQTNTDLQIMIRELQKEL